MRLTIFQKQSTTESFPDSDWLLFLPQRRNFLPAQLQLWGRAPWRWKAPFPSACCNGISMKSAHFAQTVTGILQTLFSPRFSAHLFIRLRLRSFVARIPHNAGKRNIPDGKIFSLLHALFRHRFSVHERKWEFRGLAPVFAFCVCWRLVLINSFRWTNRDPIIAPGQEGKSVQWIVDYAVPSTLPYLEWIIIEAFLQLNNHCSTVTNYTEHFCFYLILSEPLPLRGFF